MKRNNLTAAVLAGLAGIAGIASTAHAVNINPDGLGQVLIYSYYTTNDDNDTLLSVVNTTDEVKAVKVRFLEGFNSREVLDFNLYLSPQDVWVAAITDKGGIPTLIIPDNSCTVPYLYGSGGEQPFLDFAYTGDFTDGGPTGIDRASEGYFEVIEMGTVDDSEARAKDQENSWFETYADGDGDSSPARMGNAKAATHVLMEDGSEVPADCDQLVRNWTGYSSEALKTDPLDGMWLTNALGNGDCDPDDPDDQDDTDCKTEWNDVTGNGLNDNVSGLFGSASIINVPNGTMFSYDGKAIQAYDESDDGVHYIPGTIHPSLNDGDQDQAVVFFGDGVEFLDYSAAPLRTIDAVSATMMHDFVMNEFSIEAELNAATEWVFTFPTKNFYVDSATTGNIQDEWHPDPTDNGCNNWLPGDPFPSRSGPDPEDSTVPDDDDDFPNGQQGWETCTYIESSELLGALAPFTSLFGDEDCEVIGFESWDRNERPTVKPGVVGPPIVSPAPPGPPDKEKVEFLLCYEVNVLRFGDESIFGTTSDLLVTATGIPDDNGWARMDMGGEVEDEFLDDIFLPEHQDGAGMVGLPVIGFAAQEYENGFLEGGSVLANYGGLFGHKSSVRILKKLLMVILISWTVLQGL